MSFEPRVDGRSLEASYNLTAQLRLEMMERRREEEVRIDSAAVSIFVVILVELTNTVFVNSTNIATNIETGVLSSP